MFYVGVDCLPFISTLIHNTDGDLTLFFIKLAWNFLKNAQATTEPIWKQDKFSEFHTQKSSEQFGPQNSLCSYFF